MEIYNETQPLNYSKLIAQISKFAFNEEMKLTEEELSLFLLEIEKIKSLIHKIRLNPRKEKGTGGSIVVYYDIKILDHIPEKYFMRWKLAIGGKFNGYSKKESN